MALILSYYIVKNINTMKNEINFVLTAPKTYEVRYLKNENKQSNLSPATRSKVIRKWGDNYVSERASEVNPGYGPMPRSSSISFSLTITVSGDNNYKPAFEACGAKFSTCTFNSVDKAREWAKKLGNGEVKVVDTGNNDQRQTSLEKKIKKDIEKNINDFEKADLKEGEGRGYKLSYSEMA